MENAAKALLIAGGILIAIIILSMFLMMYNRMTSIQKAQEEQRELEQIAAFNAEFESYNKQLMYGVDIITIMNKSRQNNENMNAQIPENRYYINIEIKIKDGYSFASRVEQINLETGDIIAKHTGGEAKSVATDLGINISNFVLTGGKTYSLGDWRTDELEMNSEIIALFESDTDEHVEQTTIRETTYIYYIRSALNEFKKTLFKCTEVVYDDEGRIKQMTFEQK